MYTITLLSKCHWCLHVEDTPSVSDLPPIPHSQSIISSLQIELFKRQLYYLE